MREMQGEFTLHRGGRVHFPALVITGDGTRVEARGDYSLADESLDFVVNPYLLRNSNTPLVILSPLLAPFGKVLEVNLGGTLAEPRWRLALFGKPSATSPTPSPGPSRRPGN